MKYCKEDYEAIKRVSDICAKMFEGDCHKCCIREQCGNSIYSLCEIIDEALIRISSEIIKEKK